MHKKLLTVTAKRIVCCDETASVTCADCPRPRFAAMIPTPRRLVDIIGANRPYLSFAQCMEIAQDVHAELVETARR